MTRNTIIVKNRAPDPQKEGGYPEDTLWGYPAKSPASMRVSRALGYQGYLITTKTLYSNMVAVAVPIRTGDARVALLESGYPGYPVPCNVRYTMWGAK